MPVTLQVTAQELRERCRGMTGQPRYRIAHHIQFTVGDCSIGDHPTLDLPVRRAVGGARRVRLFTVSERYVIRRPVLEDLGVKEAF